MNYYAQAIEILDRCTSVDEHNILLEIVKARPGVIVSADKKLRKQVDEWSTRLLPVIEEIKDGTKIKAIKIYRGITGTSLKDAKEAVEKKMREMGL